MIDPVEEEREACARVAEREGCGGVAHRIRRRIQMEQPDYEPRKDLPPASELNRAIVSLYQAQVEILHLRAENARLKTLIHQQEEIDNDVTVAGRVGESLTGIG